MFILEIRGLLLGICWCVCDFDELRFGCCWFSQLIRELSLHQNGLQRNQQRGPWLRVQYGSSERSLENQHKDCGDVQGWYRSHCKSDECWGVARFAEEESVRSEYAEDCHESFYSQELDSSFLLVGRGTPKAADAICEVLSFCIIITV